MGGEEILMAIIAFLIGWFLRTIMSRSVVEGSTSNTCEGKSCSGGCSQYSKDNMDCSCAGNDKCFPSYHAYSNCKSALKDILSPRPEWNSGDRGHCLVTAGMNAVALEGAKCNQKEIATWCIGDRDPGCSCGGHPCTENDDCHSICANDKCASSFCLQNRCTHVY